MNENDISIVKLLSVDDIYYKAFEEHERQAHTWRAFSVSDAQNLWANGYVLMCVPANERFLNPYLEAQFSLESIYLKKLDVLLQKTSFAQQATSAQRYNVAYLFVKLLDNEAARRGMTFYDMTGGVNEVSAATLQAKKQDIVQFLHLLNAQLFFERLVEELCGAHAF